MIQKARLLPLAGALLASGQALAQLAAPVLPDPLLLDRQQRDTQRQLQERERLLTPQPRILPAPNVQNLKLESGARFVLKGVDFSDSALLPAAQLQALAAPLVGKDTGFEQLGELVNQINALYVARGQVFARALLPPQRVTEGRVRIDLVESRASSVTFEGQKRMQEPWLAELIGSPVGQVLDAAAIDRRLERFQRGSDARMTLDAAPGSEPVTSAISVKVTEPDAWGGRVSLGNEGNDSTGRAQAQGELRWFSPTGRGDRLSLNLSTSTGARSLNLNWALPLSARWGTRLVLGANAGRTHVISGPFAPLDIRGATSGWSASLAQPIWDARPWSLEAVAGYSANRSESTAGGLSAGSSRTGVSSLALQMTHRTNADETSAVLGWSKARAEAAAGAVAEAGKLEWSGSYVHRTETQNAFMLRGNGQHARSAAPLGSQALSLGGAGLLRAYAPGSLLGESGYGFSMEWHSTLAANLGWSAFAERGQVWGSAQTRQGLSDVGASIEWRPRDRTVVTGTAARALSSTPNGASRNRFYVRLSTDF